MPSGTDTILFAVATACLLSIVIPLLKNIQLARSSGLQYRIVPYLSYNRATAHLLIRCLVRPLNRLLGKPSPVSWRTLVTGTWPWKVGYAPFATLGTDTFLTVSPGGIVLHTADADVTSQITARQADFPKALHLYQSLNIYGPNVIATDGAAWRYHRRLTSPMFGESNNQLVWKQALSDGRGMLSRWLDPPSRVITTMAEDTMHLTLSVLGRAGLGQTLEWSDETTQGAESVPQKMVQAKGHEMTFTVALTTLFQHIVYIIILPRWLLRIAPFRATRKAYLAYVEWGRYLREIIAFKRQTITHTNSTGTLSNDLLTQLLKEHEDSTLSTKTERDRLSDSEILGNLFVMLIAGHETSANSILFCLTLLAMHPKEQREVQSDLDRIFGDRPVDQWDYDRDLPKLVDSRLNAVVNEELRLFAPTPTIFKYTNAPQKLIVEGKEVIVPPKTISRLCIHALHRNLKYWRNERSDNKDERADGLDNFKPSRWFNADGSWRKMPKGAFIPFSDGARACLGRRFAQVEILAVLASILTSHSVELAVDKSDPDTGFPRDDDRSTSLKLVEDDAQAWQSVRNEAQKTLKEKLTTRVTLQLMKGSCVPVTIVKRGDESFPQMF